MYEKIARRLFWVSTRHPFLTLLIITLTVGVSIPGSLGLFKNIKTDLTSLLPQDTRSVQLIQTVRDKTEGIGNLMLVVEGKNRSQIIKMITDLSVRLEKDPMIREASYTKPGYDFFDKHKLLYIGLDSLKDIRDRLDRRIQKEKLGDLFMSFEGDDDKMDFKELEEKYSDKYSRGKRSRYYESDDGSIFLVHVYPAGNSADLGFAKTLVTHVKELVSGFKPETYDPSIKVFYAGSFQNRVNEYVTLIQDLKLAGLVAALGVALLLIIRFRHLICLPLLFLPMFVGINWTFALTYLVIGQLNVVTSFLFSILTGLGVEFGIHLYSRFLEERQLGKSQEEALKTMVMTVGKASLTSATTAGVPFLLLGLNDFKGFSEFGLITGSGIFITLLAYLIVLPALLVITGRWQILSASVKKDTSGPRRVDFPRARPIFWVGLVITLACLAAVPRLSFEYDFTKLKAKVPGAAAIQELYWKVVPPKNNPSMIIAETDEDAKAIQKTLLARKEARRDSLIHSVKIVSDLVPDQQAEKLKVIGEIKKLMDDPLVNKMVKADRKKDVDLFRQSLKISAFSLKEVPFITQKIFWGKKDIPGQLVFINSIQTIELSDGKNAIQFRDEVQEVPVGDRTYYATSDSIIFADVIDIMLKDSSKAIILTLIGVLFFVFLDFRKLSHVGLVMLPILGGVLWMCGIMGFIGFKFNFYNMIVIPAVIGTAIDNGVHMFHRYREEKQSSVWNSVRTAGKASFMSSMTNILGFAGLIFAQHPGLSSIGVAALIGMGACMVSSLTLFPAALQLLQNRQKRKLLDLEGGQG